MLSNDPMSADLLRFYDFYTGPGRCGGRANRWEYPMQRYRSGHNGADSKSVWEQSHEGSNPSRCAKKISLQAGLRRL